MKRRYSQASAKYRRNGSRLLGWHQTNPTRGALRVDRLLVGWLGVVRGSTASLSKR